MTTAEQIYQQLLARAQGTPYTVSLIDGGLRVHLNVADMHWLTLFYENKLDKEYSINLLLDEASQSYTKEQVLKEVSWRAGASPIGFVPHFELSSTVSKGTMVEISSAKVAGVQEKGGLYDGYTLDTREMSKFVDEVMVPSGWSKKMDKSTKLGLIFAGVGVGVALIAVLVAIIIVLNVAK
ncbi:hypothetical protein [Psychromicrobium lacuslunae]|uniref:Uncharacterized protein n=1 Tax=Psychromicrobium lacuslunae TaxID=1618207 RepID=A0A0D4BVP2_9MICC|nr:hypothetical protein [Psychromicrobium lacuslunae]AJT40492.1 hypothetical protein UM93_01130 [Psychromicrobium lacuslunae]